MDINEVKNKISDLKSEGVSNEKILYIIEKEIDEYLSICELIHHEITKSELDESLRRAEIKADYFNANKAEVFEHMIRKAHHVLLFKGLENMCEYLDKNFDIAPELNINQLKNIVDGKEK